MQIAALLPDTATRVEARTPTWVNEALREHADAQVMRLEQADANEIAERLQQIDREWDIERVLQANAAVLSLLGWALAMRYDRRFLAVPALVFGFFAQHALQGWCPPVPVWRRLGVRTVREMERERHALKALRGDFDAVPAAGSAPVQDRVRAALAAVDA